MSIPNVPTGKLTPADVSMFLDPEGELGKDGLREVEGYGRSWTDRGRDQALMVLVYRFPQSLQAELFVAAVRQGNASPDVAAVFEVPIPGAVGQTLRSDPNEPLEGHQIYFQKDRILVHVLVVGRTVELKPKDLIAMAQQQASRIPSADVSVTESVHEDDSIAYRLGYALVPAILILGIVFLVTRQARRRRAAPAPPPVPGTEPLERVMLAEASQPDRPAIRALRRRSQAVVAFLGIAGALAIISAVVGFGLIDRLSRLQDGRAINVETLKSMAGLHDALLIVQVVATLMTGIAWMIWQHRAQRTLLGMRSQGELQFTPAWAAGWWLIPIANLLMPYQTMRELYRESAAPDSKEARVRGRTGLLVVWWMAFLGASILGRVVHSLDDSLNELVLRSKLEFATDLCYLFAAGTAIGLITLIFGGLKAQLHQIAPTVSLPALQPASATPPPPLPPPAIYDVPRAPR